MLRMFSILKIVLLVTAITNTGLVFAVNNSGAIRSDRLHSHLNHLKKKIKSYKSLVTVIVETDDFDASSRAMFKASEGVIRYSSGRRHEVKIPANRLSSLIAALPDSYYLRLPYPHQAVAVTSQGVEITGATDMHALNNAGAGVKIGIIDLGFASYTSAQASGDLPLNLSITDYTGNGVGGINHGTNVAEIVYDMAPAADLYLAKVETSIQLENAVNDMKAQGINIINHSVAWFGAAFYDGTGPLCNITDSAELAGIQWFNAMGNSRTAHYLSTFSDTDSDSRHNFSSSDNVNTVSLNQGSFFTLILNWDNYASYDVDYNLYLYNGDPDAGGSLVASSQNVQNGRRNSAPPYEIISYQAPTTATYYIVVTKANSSDVDLPLSLFTTGPSLGVRTYSSSLSQPADCNSVVSVGAVNLSDGAEGFSSEGPTTDGRNKPEISAPDRTVTSLSTSFIGTSGASPHAAGAAAILLSQNPAYTLDDIKSSLINSSHDVLTTGFDYRTGYGRISLDADQDNINHDDDNCLLILNFDQQDVDDDGMGDVCDNDIDGDGLLNTTEISLGTDPYKVDTDIDGLSDSDEVGIYFTNPLVADTDLDGFTDGDEVLSLGLNPNVSNLGHLSPKNSPDDQLDVSDLLILLRIINGIEAADYYDSIAGDINLDGVIDVRDTLLLMKKLGY